MTWTASNLILFCFYLAIVRLKTIHGRAWKERSWDQNFEETSWTGKQWGYYLVETSRESVRTDIRLWGRNNEPLALAVWVKAVETFEWESFNSSLSYFKRWSFRVEEEAKERRGRMKAELGHY